MELKAVDEIKALEEMRFEMKEEEIEAPGATKPPEKPKAKRKSKKKMKMKIAAKVEGEVTPEPEIKAPKEDIIEEEKVELEPADEIKALEEITFEVTEGIEELEFKEEGEVTPEPGIKEPVSDIIEEKLEPEPSEEITPKEEKPSAVEEIGTRRPAMKVRTKKKKKMKTKKIKTKKDK